MSLATAFPAPVPAPWCPPPGRCLPGRPAGRHPTQERMAAGRNRRRCHALRPAAPAGPRGLVGRRGAGRTVRLRGGAPGGPRRCGRGRRDGLPQEGGALGRDGPAVLRHAGQGRQLSGGLLPGLRRPPRAGTAGPGALPARGLDAGRGLVAVGGTGIGPALRSWLKDEGLHHVLAVPRNEELWTGADRGRVDEVHAVHQDQAWHRLGTGSKGSAGPTDSAGCWRSRRPPTGAATCCFAIPWRTRTTGRPTRPSPRGTAARGRSWTWPAAAGTSHVQGGPVQDTHDGGRVPRAK